MSELKGQSCPVCRTKNLTLREGAIEMPFFGKVFVFSMSCSKCKYHVSDVELEKHQEPVKYSFEISSKDDLNVRVIKSAAATVKIQYLGKIVPGPASKGYVTNIEGILERMKKQIESVKDNEEDKSIKKKAKNLLKKITRIKFGQEKVKLILEDPSGNSAIVSEKAIKTKLK
jgi:zinc finger protein